MIRRLMASRGYSKFVSDKLAVFSLVIIAIYLGLALSVGLLGLVDLADTKRRVLPDRYPGFLEKPSLEKRYQFSKWMWQDYLRTPLVEGRYDSEAEFRQAVDQGINMAERKLRDGTAEELRVAASALDQSFGDFEESWILMEEAQDEAIAYGTLIENAQAEGQDTAALASERAELLTLAAENQVLAKDKLDAFDVELESLLPMPTGWSGFVYKLRTFLGSDSKGASISAKATYSIKIAFQIGLITSLISVLLGTLLGAAAAYFGGWVDALVMWLVSTLSSIPYLVLLTVIAYMFIGTAFDNQDRPGLALIPVYVAFSSVFWIGTCRVVRGEVLKIKQLEYIEAATAVGFSRIYILIKHVIPNTAHLMFINFSLLFIGAIKSEVILSFLGLGVKGQPSWGIMISHGADGVNQFFFWEVGVATVFMFVLVLAFNIVSDALQDAFDPKHVG